MKEITVNVWPNGWMSEWPIDSFLKCSSMSEAVLSYGFRNIIKMWLALSALPTMLPRYEQNKDDSYGSPGAENRPAPCRYNHAILCVLKHSMDEWVKDRKNEWIKKCIKGAQAWEFFALVFCTKWTHLGMWLRNWGKKSNFLSIDPWFWWFMVFCRILSVP